MAAFEVRVLQDGAFFAFENMPSNVTEIPNANSARDRVAYHKIAITNPATFNSFSITSDTVIMYRFTVQVNPDHNSRGFDGLADALGKGHPLPPWISGRKWLLIHVVPDKIKGKIKSKSIENGGKWEDYIEQCVLGLTLEQRL
jgi:hypothetical protein